MHYSVSVIVFILSKFTSVALKSNVSKQVLIDVLKKLLEYQNVGDISP